jgi:hypothetical protein
VSPSLGPLPKTGGNEKDIVVCGTGSVSSGGIGLPPGIDDMTLYDKVLVKLLSRDAGSAIIFGLKLVLRSQDEHVPMV